MQCQNPTPRGMQLPENRVFGENQALREASCGCWYQWEHLLQDTPKLTPGTGTDLPNIAVALKKKKNHTFVHNPTKAMHEWLQEPVYFLASSTQ